MIRRGFQFRTSGFQNSGTAASPHQNIQHEKGFHFVQGTNDDVDMQWTINIELLRILAEYLNICGSLKYDDSILTTVYHRIEASWTLEYMRVSVICPLICFQANIERIQISDQLVLEPITLEEKEKIWVDYGFISKEEFCSCKWKLKYTFERKKRDPIGLTTESIDSITKCITALRLLQTGNIGISAFFEIVEPPCDINAASTGATGSVETQFSLPYFVKRYSLNEYILHEEHVNEFFRIYNKLSDSLISKKVAALNVGIRRFNYTYSRESIEDKLIDLTICLESIVLFGTKDELKYRLSLRGAALVADVESPQQTAKLLKALYDVRSKIVHEGKLLQELQDKRGNVSGIPFNSFLSLAHEICRKVINANLRQMTDNFGLAEICGQLDENIIVSVGHKCNIG